MRTGKLYGGLLCALAAVQTAGASQLIEGFENVAGLAGWAIVNESVGVGSTNWFQGVPPIFPAHAGPADSYAAANFNAATFGGNVSLWLLTPMVTLDNGVALTFWTRTENPQVAIDQLQVWASTNGASTATSDFTMFGLTVNPVPTLTGYPGDWTQFTMTISGLGGPVTGRFGFRYLVTDTSVNGDFIGLDSVEISDPRTVIPEPVSMSVVGLGVGAMLLVARRRRS